MEIIRNTVPFDYSGTYRLLSDIFGEDEARLELPSLDGTESPYNDDIIYTAEDAGVTHGTIHATVAKGQREGEGVKICGLSGLCTDMAVRGTGIGKALFGKISEESDANGCDASFLGTNNPMASHLYSTFGYAYIPGSYVMARFYGTNRVKFFSEYFKEPTDMTVRELNASDKNAVIPLFLNEGPGFLLDSVTGVFNNRVITQRSCMGLYPRYENVMKAEGKAYAAVSERGILGGIASMGPDGVADFFCQDSFGDSAAMLLASLGDGAKIRISELDTRKKDILMGLGYKETVSVAVPYGEISVPCSIFERG